MSFSSRRPSKMAVCSGLSAGANPAADRRCFPKGEGAFVVVGYCVFSMTRSLGLPSANHHLSIGFAVGPAPIDGLMRSHEACVYDAFLPDRRRGSPRPHGHVASSCSPETVLPLTQLRLLHAPGVSTMGAAGRGSLSGWFLSGATVWRHRAGTTMKPCSLTMRVLPFFLLAVRLLAASSCQHEYSVTTLPLANCQPKLVAQRVTCVTSVTWFWR